MTWDVTVRYKGGEVLFAGIRGTCEADAVQRVLFWIGRDYGTSLVVAVEGRN